MTSARARNEPYVLVTALILSCGGKEAPSPPTDAGTDSATVETTPDTKPSPPCTGPITPDDPPIECGPKDALAPKCPDKSKVATCPISNPCLAPVLQSGDLLRHRMGRMRLYAPESLLSITAIAFDPNVNPRCLNNGTESLSWLLRIDRKASTLTTGGAHASTDGGRTFSFSTESTASPTAACPGFAVAPAPVSLAPATTNLTFAGETFTSGSIPALNIPIYDSGGSAPIVLPLRELVFKSARLAAGGTCIGGWEPDYWCDGDTTGWTTGGAILAKIPVAEADRMPVVTASCQSLCAILANDATKTTKDSGGHTVCKKNPDGLTYPDIGDVCIGGGSCKNAFRFSITFASYGVTITP